MAAQLSDGDEVLFRQVHPNSLALGVPGSNCFMPTQADHHMLSLDRSSLTTAEMAHRLYTSAGRRSAAVFGLSVSEFRDSDIPCFEDPVTGHHTLPDNAAHALADFSAHDRQHQKIVAKRLKRLAIARGCMFEAS
ncbi:hypothetical protein [Roseateles sp. MS654]|uniref:hypothetical protein n=1 Tax=Roseateles sp. MS654 TaxID=3412685 RepID=UPI003C2C9896